MDIFRKLSRVACCARFSYTVGGPKRIAHGVRGFTLIELMVVVAIIAILAAIAVPSFESMLRNNRLVAASSALQVSLNLARSEAINRGSDSKVTIAANGTAGNWGNGWTVFEDKTSNANAGVGLASDGSSGTRIQIFSKLPSSSTLYAQTGSLNYFTYNGTGRLVTSTGGVANRSFWFYETGSEKYCIVISVTGRVRTEKIASSANCAAD